MTNKRAIEILSGEITCRYTDCSCEIDCSNCAFVTPTPTHEIVEAYYMAIKALQKENNHEQIS